MISVNDRDGEPWPCWICGAPDDHVSVPHSKATGDGLSRYDIVAYMEQGGYAWRPEE